MTVEKRKNAIELLIFFGITYGTMDAVSVAGRKKI